MGTFTSKYTGAQIEARLDAVTSKQDALVSGTNIKTVNNESLLGSGNITIQGGGGFVLEGEYENEVFALTEGTFSDAYAQLEDGKSVYLRFTSDETGMSGLYLIAEAVYYNSTTIVFALDLTDANYIISIHSNGLGSVTRDGLQPKLVSGTNIKTINNQTVLGSGNINIEAGETDSSMSPTSENPVQNKVIYAQLAGKVGSETVDNIVELTKVQYDALATKDNATLYILNDVGEAYIGSTLISGVGFESVSSPTPADGTATITLTNGDTITLDLNHSHPGYYAKAAETTQPGGGFLPDVVYALGTLTGTVTFALAAAVSGNVNHYFWTFDTGSTAPTITWPSGITWVDSAPTVAENKHYQISILGGIAAYMEA